MPHIRVQTIKGKSIFHQAAPGRRSTPLLPHSSFTPLLCLSHSFTLFPFHLSLLCFFLLFAASSSSPFSFSSCHLLLPSLDLGPPFFSSFPFPIFNFPVTISSFFLFGVLSLSCLVLVSLPPPSQSSPLPFPLSRLLIPSFPCVLSYSLTPPHPFSSLPTIALSFV